jgi:hypothetical protein
MSPRGHGRSVAGMNTSSEIHQLPSSHLTIRLALFASAIVISALLVAGTPAGAGMAETAVVGLTDVHPTMPDAAPIDPAVDTRTSRTLPDTSAASADAGTLAGGIALVGASTSSAPAPALTASRGPRRPSNEASTPNADAVPGATTTDSGPAATFTYDLYRDGVFTTQKTITWCTAASTQLMLNIALHQQDHSRASQQRYIRYEHHHDLYAPDEARGSDPLGWASAVNHFEGGNDYAAATSMTFGDAIGHAAGRLRLKGKPVGLLVKKGHHAWVMTGFSATADPATTESFSVTQVMVTGPLYPMQQKHGYDMAPDTALTIEQFQSFFKPYTDDVMPTNPWQGLYVTIEP